MAKTTDAKLQYIKRWKAENIRTFKFECNTREDADIIEFLDGLKAENWSRTACIKAALREYMKVD